MEKSIAKLQKKQLDVKAVEQNDVKNVQLSSNVVRLKEDYNTLMTAAQKYMAQVKKENKLQKLLDTAKRKIEQLGKNISELTKMVTSLTKQLDQCRSFRGQIIVSTFKKEDEDLRKSNGLYKSIIEQHSLGNL